VDFGNLHAGILDGHAAGFDGAVDQLFDQRLELGARDLQVQVLGTGRVGRDVRQVDFGLLAGRQFDLGLFGRFFQALQGQDVLGQVNALLFLEFTDDVVDDALVEDRKSTRLNSSHVKISYAVFCLKQKTARNHYRP